MAIPRPPKKLKLLPSVRVSDGLYIAVLEYLAVNKEMTLGELVRKSLALFITGDQDHDFDSESTVIVGASKVFRNSELDQQSYALHRATERDQAL